MNKKSFVCIGVVAAAFIIGSCVGWFVYVAAHPEPIHVDPEPLPLSWNDLPKNFLYSNFLINQDLDHCTTNNTTTTDTNSCFTTAMNAYDAILNNAYELTSQNIDQAESAYGIANDTKNALEDEKAMIENAKGSFTQYRESSCKAAYDEAVGGTVRDQQYDSCYLQATRAQIQTVCTMGEKSVCEGKVEF